MTADVLIVGGGLAGLALADMLDRAGTPFTLLEARDRPGGRVLSASSGGAAFDLGPAWFWPGQPRLAAMVDRFGLRRFAQHDEGALTFEDERGRVERGRGFASMQGSWRIDGGVARVTDGLAAHLPSERLCFNAEVTAVSRTASGVTVTRADGVTHTASHVVLALPPRLAAHGIRFAPELPHDAMRTMSAIPTWMAGQAKAVAIYDTPFWRAQGLSGDAMSRRGPLVEIHDATPMDGQVGALFGFVGVPPSARAEQGTLCAQIIAQLQRLFGPEAASPNEVLIKDWANDRFTAAPRDLAPLTHHPDYGMPTALRDLWDGQLCFAGTEVAARFGGYLEGALEAAESIAQSLGQTDTALIGL